MLLMMIYLAHVTVRSATGGGLQRSRLIVLKEGMGERETAVIFSTRFTHFFDPIRY